MAEPTKLKVEIETVATGNGAATVANDVARVTNAAKKTGEGAKEVKGLGETIAALGAKSNPAREAIEGLEHASKGGIASFFGLAKAFRAVMEIGTAGSPFGIILTAVAALAGAGLLIKEKFFAPAEEGLKKVGAEADKTAERMTHLQALQLNFEKQKRELEELKEKFAQTQAQTDSLFKSQERLRDANLGNTIAKIDLREQQQLAKSGGNEDRKKEIAAQAEAERVLARSAAEQTKINEQLQKTQSDLLALQNQRKIEAQKLNEILASETLIEQATADVRKKAQAGNVKSDQRAALDELAKLQREQAKADKEVAPFKAAGFENAVRTLEDNPEAVGRRARIAELTKQQPDLQQAIRSGKETFDATSEKLKAELEAASKAFKSDSTSENANILALAKARVAVLEDLKKLPEQDAAEKQKEEERRTRRKSLADLDVEITAKQGEAKALLVDRETAALKKGVDVTKQKSAIEEENARRAKLAEEARAKEEDRQAKLRENADKSSRVFSSSAEGQKLEQERAALELGQPSSVPNQFRVSEIDSAARELRKSKIGGDGGAPEKIDSAAKKIDEAKPVDAGKIGESVEKIATSLDESLTKTQASIDKTAASIQSATQELPPPLNAEPVSEQFSGYHQENLSLHKQSQIAIDRLGQDLNRLRQQLAALRQ